MLPAFCLVLLAIAALFFFFRFMLSVFLLEGRYARL